MSTSSCTYQHGTQAKDDVHGEITRTSSVELLPNTFTSVVLVCVCVCPTRLLLQANLAALKVLPTRSAAVRSYADSHLLEELAGRLATVALSGFIFFGSSVLMSDKVCICASMCAAQHRPALLP